MADNEELPGVYKKIKTDSSRDSVEAAMEIPEAPKTGTPFQSIASEQDKKAMCSGRLVRKHDDLFSCLAVMRRLMEQAESESKQLKEEKYVIAAKINNSLSSVNREVEHLKAELRDQDRRLGELASEKIEPASAREERTVSRSMSDSSGDNQPLNTKLDKLTEENTRLRKEIEFLSKELSEFKESNSNLAELYERLHCYEHEIGRAKETIVCMKTDRKKLKGEKMELLNQMKQVYGILEDKESELREFIRNYEQQMTASDIKVRQLLSEKDSWEHERKESQHSIEDLTNKLRTKETHFKVIESELLEVKQRMALLRMNIPSPQQHGDTNLNISNSSSRFSRAIQADVEKLMYIHNSGESTDSLAKTPLSLAGKFDLL